MNDHQKIIIEALSYIRGDNLERSRQAFKIFSATEMAQQHGKSGQTRQQILDGYERHAEKVDAAVAWVTSI